MAASAEAAQSLLPTLGRPKVTRRTSAVGHVSVAHTAAMDATPAPAHTTPFATAADEMQVLMLCSKGSRPASAAEYHVGPRGNQRGVAGERA